MPRPKKSSDLTLPTIKGPCKVLVTGGRNYTDSALVSSALSSFHKKIGMKALIHGAARGADTLCANWAVLSKVTPVPYPAKWGTLGLEAGPIRNTEMLAKEPDIDILIAFPGEEGTKDMVSKAMAKGIPVWYPAGRIALKPSSETDDSTEKNASEKKRIRRK